MKSAIIATAAVLSVGALAAAAGVAGYLSHREPAPTVEAQADLSGTLGNIPTSAPAPPIGNGPAAPPPPQATPAPPPNPPAASPRAAVGAIPRAAVGATPKPAAARSPQVESTAGEFFRFLRDHRRPPFFDRV